jgi:uncharacterized protein (TIGR00255 family)
MTGFGKGLLSTPIAEISVEIRSVNARFLETTIRMPRNLNGAENEIRNLIQKKVGRGTLSCFINIEQKSGEKKIHGYNPEILDSWINIAREIRERHNLEDQITLSQVMQIPDLLIYTDDSELADELTKGLLKATELALDELIVMRLREGENLYKDMVQRINTIDKTLDAIEALIPERQVYMKERLEERVRTLMGTYEPTEDRLIQEISLIADKQDITEEIVRFRSHNQLFLESLENPPPHGKRLNFILQEMGREANTLGTKSQFTEITHRAMGLKEEVEIIREQVMNLE